MLCLALLPVVSSCKKKTREKGSRDILADDPFYETEVYELKFPIDTTKKVEYRSVDDIRFMGDKILANYSIQYEYPEVYSEDIKWEDYSKQGTAMFSLQGEYLGEAALGTVGEVDCAAMDNDGNLATLEMIHNDEYEITGMKIVYRDDAGKARKELPLEMPVSAEITYVSFMQFLPDGKIALQPSYAAPVYVFNENGKYLFSIFAISRGLCGEIFMQNGKYYAFSMPTDWFGTIDYLIHEIDMNTGVMSPGKKVSGVFDVSMLTYGEDGVYVSSPNGISKCDPTTGELQVLFDWNQTDVNRSILSSVRSKPVNENEIRAIARKYSNNFIDDTYYVVNLKRAKKNPHAGKKILYVGGIGLTSGFYDYMYTYNADTSHEYRIEATDYSYSAETGGALDEHFATNVTNRINLMMISGEAPDILVNFAGFDQYASDAMLVDLNTYIDGAQALARGDYFDNIFRSMEVNGKLYFMPLNFQLEGFMTNTKYLDADTNWTFDDLDRAAAKLPEGTLLLPPTESEDLLRMILCSDMTAYLDYSKKKVNFNSKEMVRVFEEVKKYATKEDLSDRNFLSGVVGTSNYGGLKVYDTAETPGLGNKPVVKLADYLKNGQSAMISVRISDLNDYSLYQGLVEGNGKFIGYPTLTGSGVRAQSLESLAIYAGSPYKDEAWEVIRSFFTSEAQLAVTSESDKGFPLLRSAFDEEAKAEKEKIDVAYEAYLKDAALNDVWGTIVYPVQDGQIDDLRAIIENVRCSYHTDEAVMDVILEEAPGYFKDARSAEEVLKNIDNRAQKIVQER